MSALCYALLAWGLANALVLLVCTLPFGRLMHRVRARDAREPNWRW
jgi:hypothetical protein